MNISSPCIDVSRSAREMSITQPTKKPTPRQPRTLDRICARSAASTAACFSLQLLSPRVQSFLELSRGSTDQKDWVMGMMKATSAAMRNQ